MEKQREYWRMWGAMLALVMLTIVMTLLGGCTKTVYVPAESSTARTNQ